MHDMSSDHRVPVSVAGALDVMAAITVASWRRPRAMPGRAGKAVMSVGCASYG
jgi:hypothetical protein